MIEKHTVVYQAQDKNLLLNLRLNWEDSRGRWLEHEAGRTWKDPTKDDTSKEPILSLLSDQIHTANHGPGIAPGVCPQISRTLCSGFAIVCLIGVIDELKDSFELGIANT